MKRYIFTLLAALLTGIAPLTAQAQPVAVGPLTLDSHILKTQVTGFNGQGGVFGAALGTDPTSLPRVVDITFNDYVVFCIDAGRTINVGSTYTNYFLYDFGQFAASTLGVTNGVTVNDLTFIASRVEDYKSDNLPSVNNSIQGDIWRRFANVENVVIGDAPLRNWGVLANGVNQTFLVELPKTTQVPEPSSTVLLSAGLLVLGFVSRRKSVTV